jgi:hypothetical protein
LLRPPNHRDDRLNWRSALSSANEGLDGPDARDVVSVVSCSTTRRLHVVVQLDQQQPAAAPLLARHVSLPLATPARQHATCLPQLGLQRSSMRASGPSPMVALL